MIRLISEFRIIEGTEEEVLSAIREFVAAVHREVTAVNERDLLLKSAQSAGKITVI